MNQTKGSKGMLKFAILAVALVCQINTIASVMMADIAAAFPGASDVAVQYVMQSGMIGGFVVALLMSVLSTRFRKKPMILIGLVAILVGGLLPIAVHSSILILDVCGFIVGAGQGFLTPLLGALILENFEGKEREQMLGLNTTFGTGGATVLLLIAGPVCKTGWVNVYFIYFVVIPVLIIALLCLAMDNKPQAAAQAGGDKAGVPVKGWIQCILAVLMMIAYAAFPLNLSLYVVRDAAIGDASSVGIGMSLVTVVAALVGLILPQIIKVSKLYISSVGAVFGLAATLLVIFSTNMVMIYIAAILDGIFFGIVMAGAGYIIGRICTPAQYGPTFSISMSFISLGTIFSPIIINAITTLWGGDVGLSTNAFYTAAGIFAVVIVLQIIWGTYLTKTLPPEKTES
ncbi:MFS transporter [Pseudoflavonifractor sp.]|uniref:MFS transporter n=1 Tax=Pseudoflavonifractor sp. TaxID=1980281 RepID=UPI003D917AA4